MYFVFLYYSFYRFSYAYLGLTRVIAPVLYSCAGHRFADAAFLYKLSLLHLNILHHHYIHLVTHCDGHIGDFLIIHLLQPGHIILAVIRLAAELPQTLISRMVLIPCGHLPYS